MKKLTKKARQRSLRSSLSGKAKEQGRGYYPARYPVLITEEN